MCRDVLRADTQLKAARACVVCRYRFTLPYEVAGFCTLLLPKGCPAGASAQLRHGECVDRRHNGLLLPVEAPSIKRSATDTYHLRRHKYSDLNPDLTEIYLRFEISIPVLMMRSRYTCRGDATGMGTHDRSWRRLAVSGSAAVGSRDEPLEAFTPSFTYSAFKYVEVTYRGSKAPLPAPNASSMRCFRVGVGFDWIGDVTVGDDVPPTMSRAILPQASTPVPPPAKMARCGRVWENHDLTLGCSGGQKIDKIMFASFGSTAGSCAAGFRAGICTKTGKIGNANCSVDVVAHLCVGKTSCVVPATVETFGQPCPHVVKSLAAEVLCSGDSPSPRGDDCKHSCYDDTTWPPMPPGPNPPAPAPAPGGASSTPAQRFNAVMAAARSTAIANFVMGTWHSSDSPICCALLRVETIRTRGALRF
jgi:hypothetical protein